MIIVVSKLQSKYENKMGSRLLTLFIPGFLTGVVRGGGVHFHSVTPLPLKSDDSNFVQNHFRVRKIMTKSKMT